MSAPIRHVLRLRNICVNKVVNSSFTGFRNANIHGRCYPSRSINLWNSTKPFVKFKTCSKHGILLALGAGVATGFLVKEATSRFDTFDTLFSGHVHAAEPDTPVAHRATMNFVADVVEKTLPAVVYIEILGRHPFTGQMTAISNGSGFIVRSDGLVLTNAHVVANKAEVNVKLPDGRTLKGVVQAVDQISDLATIRMFGEKNLPTLPLGKSSDIRPGEWVIAMGSPFQLSNTVTAGIVSTTERGSKELGLHNKDIKYIQTDAVINFGNSGGPLVNLDGEAIGINTMKVTTGISFAIPSDYAKEFLRKAADIEKRSGNNSKSWFSSQAKPQSTRRYMGITMLTLTSDIIKELRTRQEGLSLNDIDHGVLVHRIVVGSPAHSGGMHPGDIITNINQNKVHSAKDVYDAVDKSENLRVTVKSGTEYVHLTVIPEDALS